jgi:hypothetical protein
VDSLNQPGGKPKHGELRSLDKQLCQKQAEAGSRASGRPGKKDKGCIGRAGYQPFAVHVDRLLSAIADETAQFRVSIVGHAALGLIALSLSPIARLRSISS